MKTGNLGDNKDRFALPLITKIDLLSNATTLIEGEYKIHSVRLIARDALNISVEFDPFFIGENSILSVFTEKEITDSITSFENNRQNVWNTRVYNGNVLNIVLKEKINKGTESRIGISKVYFGYKAYGQQFGAPGSSASCEVNVACNVGNGWEEERNSVALINANGRWATGALIMNTCNTNRPYFLTAHHALSAGNVSNWVFQFLYFSTSCSTNADYREDLQFNGCQLRANDAGSDFALLELNQTPASNSGLRYAGWSRQTTNIQSTTILHHPAGDVLKITRDINSPTSQSFLGAQCWHLVVDEGTTEGGSSGAPYFDQNHRIIGQHDGIDDANLSTCDQVSKFGGRFDVSWTGGGSDATRLSNWLDPNGTSAITTNTTNVSNLLPASLNLSITGGSATICSGSSTYTLNGAPTGVGIVWSVSNPSIASLSSSGNQATVTMTGNGSIYLTATVGGACFSNNVKTTTIRLGTYSSSEFDIYSEPVGQPFCNNQLVTFGPAASELLAPSTYYNWSWGSGWTYVSGSNTRYLQLRVNTGGYYSYGTVTLRAGNDCGTSDLKYKIFYFNSGCYSPYRVSPNPSTGMIRIEPSIGNKEVNIAEIREIEIVDRRGLTRLKNKFAKGQTQMNLNISFLPNDVYTLRIFDGEIWHSHKVVVLH